MTAITHTSFASFTALTYNARLWGGTGLVNGEATRLYCEDHQRVDRIADRLITTGPDLIGLQEVFCPEMQDRLIERLRDDYPYHVRSSTFDGVEQSIRTVRRLWPRFGDLYARNIQKVVDGFTLSHYSRDGLPTRLLKRFISEDAVLRFLHEAAEQQFLWGAGLLFFSKSPVLEHSFVPHPERADLERFADKGTLKVTVQPPQTDPITVLLTHLQEGETPHARSARRLQLGRIQGLMREAGKAVVLGDMNVPEGWPDSYREMAAGMLQAGGFDCFRTVYPDRRENPGYTYRVGNPFERTLLGESHPFVGEDLRLDYIFARGLRVLGSGVLEDDFSGLSDHSPVLVRFGSSLIVSGPSSTDRAAPTGRAAV
ncbi:MAG TPA: endonuclease/exonuclease/phosphatase family protein [bacterium]|nr:endonuclease/exonuclease/phosphatase family protein [bacterium]